MISFHGTTILTLLFLFAMVSTPAESDENPGDMPANAQVLTLKNALARGIERNLDLQVEAINIPIHRDQVVIDDSAFDSTVEGSMYTQEERTPTASSLAQGGLNITRTIGGSTAIRKKFTFGLESSLSLETSRSENNSRNDTLRPQYRDILLLNLTQPLLRDFGTKINTVNRTISQNQVEQAVHGYLDKAQRIGEEIETVYFDLAEAASILQSRIQSQDFARELLQGNREKLNAGVVPISEVQQAETALASRNEQVISAQQQLEIVTQRLKDLLEIRSGDPLYAVFFVTQEMTATEQTHPNLENALETAYQKRPDLKQQDLAIAAWKLRLEYYRNQKLPRIDLVGTFGVNGLSGQERPSVDIGSTSTQPNRYVGDYFDAFPNMIEAQGMEWYIGVKVSYPLGNRAALARLHQADREKIQAILKRKRLEGAVETEVKNALAVVERSWERVQVARQFEELAAVTLEQETARLQEGLTDTFHILKYQDDVVESRIRKTTAMADYHQGLAHLHRAMGTNLERYDIEADYENQESLHER